MLLSPRAARNREVVGSIPAGCWAFFIFLSTIVVAQVIERQYSVFCASQVQILVRTWLFWYIILARCLAFSENVQKNNAYSFVFTASYHHLPLQTYQL